MNCKTCQNHIQDLIDNQLDEARARIVSEHLAICPDCAKQHRDFQNLAKVMSRIPERDVVLAVRNAALIAKSKGAKRKLARLVILRRTVRVAACFALLLMILSVSLINRNTRVRMPEVTETALAPYDLVSLHATARSSLPLADSGKISFAITESTAMDYADNALPDSE